MTVPPPVATFAARAAELDWVTDLWVAGSLATGDYVAGVSDLDLVAVVEGAVNRERADAVAAIHEELDRGPAAGADLGCVYVDRHRLAEPEFRHPTWTHGQLVHRPLSRVSRSELVLHGFAVFGRPPAVLLPGVRDDDVRAAARAELCGYWSWAARRPWMWRSPVIADLGLTAMARGRHALRTGRLLSKSDAVHQADAPDWLVDQLAARRRGEPVVSPRLRSGWIAWRDARRTVRAARRAAPGDN